MELLNSKIIHYQFNEANYKEYLLKLNKLKELLKQDTKYNYLIESLNSLNNNKICIYFLFFQNYNEWISVHFENEFNNINLINLFKINDIINKSEKSIFDLIILWIFFLYAELIRNICLGEFPNNICEINKIRYLLKETNIYIVKLYKSNILNSTQVFNIIDFFLFLIENKFEVTSIPDKLFLIKNYLLLKGLFFIFQEVSVKILSKKDLNNMDSKESYKNELEKIFIFLESLQKSKEINTQLNIMIIINYNLLTKFMSRILENIDIKTLYKEIPTFKNQLINFYSHFIKFNYKKSKIFELFLDSLKYSFINLYNFEINIEKIIQNLFIQGFYTKLIKKIFFFDENSSSSISRPLFDSFFYNGFDSQISLNIPNNKFLEKSSLFLSFNILPLKDINTYPLFVIDKENDKTNKKEVLFSIYLKKIEEKEHKKEHEEYDLYIYKDEGENKIELHQKIISSATYYFNISFNVNKVSISVYNGKGEIMQFELDKLKKLFESNSFDMTFGFLNKDTNSFSGYIGPIIIVKNPLKINDLIPLVLKLQANYKNFIFLDQNLNFFFEYKNHFQTFKILHKIRSKFDNINLECLLYLTPEILCFLNEKSDKKIHLPNIGDICKSQKYYNIIKLNVTLVKHEQGIVNFMMDNGLDYICLLYEYLFQFLKNYIEKKNNEINENKEFIFKMISSIFKKTLFILDKNYYELNSNNFNKNYKQIYMNLFSCIKLISTSNIYFIMDDLINCFFNIILNYRSNISDILNERKKNLKRNDSEFNIYYKNYNNDLLKINLSFLSGWIDFILIPELYNFNNNKKTLIKLFDKISTYFDFEGEKEASTIINQHFLSKLLDFISFYNVNPQDNISILNDIDEDKNNISNIEEKNEEALNCFFKSLKSFFENNPSKSENIIYLKNIINNINENFGNNYEICLYYYNFIEELIGNDPDLYFNDEKDEDQIKMLIIYANKYSDTYILDQDLKNENKIKTKKYIFNKIISIIMRIIYTKKRINKNTGIITDFKKFIQRIDITSDLIKTLTKEINNIIDYSIGVSKNDIKNKKKINTDKNLKHFTTDELRYVSNFYSEIFDLILFFLEYPINKNNINNINILNICEENVYELLELIEFMIKANIENNDKIDIENEKNELNGNNGLITIDTIYCLIYFLKFYDNILFKRLYPENYIKNFISVCELCCKSCLINSNILIETEYSTKTILELILDICLHYIIKSSREFYDPLPIEQINGVRNESVINEQTMIYNFLANLFPKNINSKSKENKQKYTIFYNNDYLRLLSEISENKKKLKKDSEYIEYYKEYNNYKIINNLLFNEQKFNLNFSTFFLIKLSGYNKILMELNVRLNSAVPDIKKYLKFNELLQMIVESIEIIYNEHELLFKKNKEFFFRSKKANSTSYNYYIEIKKRIEHCFKKKEYKQVTDYILNEIFENDKEKVYNLINSGLCCKKESKAFSFSLLTSHKKSEDLSEIISKSEKKKSFWQKGRTALSSDNLIHLSEEEENDASKTFFKKKSKTIITKSLIQGNNSAENNKEKIINQDEDSSSTFEFCFEEDTPPSSGGNINNNDIIELEKKNNNCDNSKNIKSNNNSDSNKILCPSPTIQRIPNKQKTLKTSKNLNNEYFDNNNFVQKERSASFYSCSSSRSNNNYSSNDENISTYVNFFDMPDEFYLKNPKKELMMNVFSIYFLDNFFCNKKFNQMKNYYIQNFKGIQESTKIIDFPSKIKNFSNGLEPFLFLKPFSTFFLSKYFPITHKYFYDYMKEKKIMPEPIILYQKILPKFNLENQFTKKCELIKIDNSYYGCMIGSKNLNFFIFEEQKYDFYEKKDIICNKRSIESRDLEDLFTFSFVNSKPKSKHEQKIIKNLEQNILNQRKNTREKKYVIILFNEIEEILERRFLLTWQALEIYLRNGKSYFFNFLTKDKCKFILDILKKNIITKDKIHERDYFKNQKYITSEWVEERLSTYEYLLLLNKYSSRTFNDVNQYPVFPWLIKESPENEEGKDIYRDLKYPMASQTEENKSAAITRFKDDEDNKVKFPAHFGTHYSTSAYVYFYLMREEPFTTLLVKLQGYKQENPDRMFYSIKEVLYVLNSGHDNREMIPDLYYKIEPFINLNCVNFGKKNNNIRVDDFITNENTKITDNNYKMSNFVKFIIDNKKLIEDKKILNKMNDWIDIIFGVGQLPDKNRIKCLNIFYKETYEQKTDLHMKLKKLLNKSKNGIKIEEIINKISNKIDLIISFGQTPYQLFNDKHPKYGKKQLINDEDDFEYKLTDMAWKKDMKSSIEIEPIFFIINSNLGKIFLIDKQRKLEIIDSALYIGSGNEKYQFNSYGQLQLSHIKFYDKININEDNQFLYYIIKQYYCISSFDEKNNFNLNQAVSHRESENKLKTSPSKGNDIKQGPIISNISNNIIDSENNNSIYYIYNNDNDYISYYNLYINKLKIENIKKESKKAKKLIKEEEYFRFITCRYLDNSFKIHNIPRNNAKLKKDYIPMSFICEDFVTSCCTITHNKFLIGLRNGKLIQWSIDNEISDDGSSKKQNLKSKIKIMFNKQIQAHKKAINIIEIEHRLGVIITGGEDNYIFIRKIYDFELITPIKIKSKYIITMAKVSPMNFLYIICFNKNKNKSVILGYTINGLYFAKSSYGYYDTLDFTKSGNIVTWIHKKEIQILNGYNLKDISPKENDFDKIQKKLIGASWIKFNYISIKNDQESNTKIITYTFFEKNKVKAILTIDVSKSKYFD